MERLSTILPVASPVTTIDSLSPGGEASSRSWFQRCQSVPGNSYTPKPEMPYNLPKRTTFASRAAAADAIDPKKALPASLQMAEAGQVPVKSYIEIIDETTPSLRKRAA